MIGAEPITLQFCNRMPEHLRKPTLVHGALKDGEFSAVLQQNILEQDTPADIADARQMFPPGLKQHLPGKPTKPKDIHLKEARPMCQSLGQCPLRRIGHVLGNEKDALAPERLLPQHIPHRRETVMCFARPRPPDDKLQSCRHIANPPFCVKDA